MHIIHARSSQDDPTACDQALVDAFRHDLEQQDLAPSTIASYLHDLKLFRDWLAWIYEGRHMPLDAVRMQELAAFRTHLIREKNQRPATINRRVQSLRLFYRFLVQKGHTAQNPALKLRYMRRTPPARPQALRRSEVMALIRAAALSQHGQAIRNAALLQLMLQTGLRVGEVVRLRHADLTLKARSGLVCVRAGKGIRAREVPLNQTARRALKAYLTELRDRSAKRAEHEPLDDPDQPLFLSKRCGPFTARGVQRVVKTLAERADIDRISVSAHTLRHTFATNYLKSNPGGLVELARLLGHESLDTTAIYTKPSEEDLAEGLERSALNVFADG